MPLRPLLILALTSSLAACASAEPQMAFEPRAGANLSGDRAECRRTADDLDINSPKEYTDGRYGSAAAMASRLDHASVQGGTIDRLRDAVFQDCMVRKGWTPK